MFVKLPEVQIKHFTGNLLDYKARQIFEATVINNSSLLDVQRFTYLKSFLEGEPLKLIENLDILNDNFQIALKLLDTRYENKTSVINAHFRSLFDSSISKTKVTNYLPEFISLKIFFFWYVVYLLEKKLDPSTKRAYEQSKDTDELPSIEEFFKLLEKRRTVNENLTYVESSLTSSGTTHRKKPYENPLSFPVLIKVKYLPLIVCFVKILITFMCVKKLKTLLIKINRIL